MMTLLCHYTKQFADNQDEQSIVGSSAQKHYYNYISECYIDNICKEIEFHDKEIEKMKVPESLDTWFDSYISEINKKEMRSRGIRKIKSIPSKAAIIVSVLMLSLFFVTISVEAIRIKVLNFLMEDHERFANVVVEENQSDRPYFIGWEGYYTPIYIPDGFEIKATQEFFQTKIIEYDNKSGERIIFTQAPNGTHLQLDTEDATVKEMEINNQKGILIGKEGRNILFWSDENLSFCISSGIESEEIIKIAKNLEKK